MRRKFNFVLQAKGGVGKSFFTYLAALAETSRNSLFVDVDSFVKSSTRQLKFLGEARFDSLSLIDSREVLVRDIFVGYLESLTESGFTEIFMDFGAPESDQFPALLSRDLDFKEWCDELEFDATFHIIMAAGTDYQPCVEYLQKIIAAVKGELRIIVWENLNSFQQFPALSAELARNCKLLQLELRKFGDFDGSSLLGKQILDGMRSGFGLGDYPPGARIRLKKELNENFQSWQ